MVEEIVCTVLVVVLAQGTIMGHELGHAAAMRRHGVQVGSINLGFGPVLARRELRGGTRFQVRLLPLGGFVLSQDQEFADSLTGRQAAETYGIGVSISVCLGLLLGGLGNLAPGRRPALGLALIALAILVWVTRWFLARWVLVFALVNLAGTTYAAYLVAHHAGGMTGRDLLPSPLGLVQWLVVHNPLDALTIAGAISLSMGLFNALPLGGLDGGKTAGRWLRDRYGTGVEGAFFWSTFSIFALVFIGSTVSDAAHLL